MQQSVECSPWVQPEPTLFAFWERARKTSGLAVPMSDLVLTSALVQPTLFTRRRALGAVPRHGEVNVARESVLEGLGLAGLFRSR